MNIGIGRIDINVDGLKLDVGYDIVNGMVVDACIGDLDILERFSESFCERIYEEFEKVYEKGINT